MTSRSHGRLFCLGAPSHETRVRDSVVLCAGERLRCGLRECVQTCRSISVPVLDCLQVSASALKASGRAKRSTHLGIPFPSRHDVLFTAYADFGIIAHGKFRTSKAIACRLQEAFREILTYRADTRTFSANVTASVSSFSKAPSAPQRNHLERAMSASGSPCWDARLESRQVGANSSVLTPRTYNTAH